MQIILPTCIHLGRETATSENTQLQSDGYLQPVNLH